MRDARGKKCRERVFFRGSTLGKWSRTIISRGPRVRKIGSGVKTMGPPIGGRVERIKFTRALITGTRRPLIFTRARVFPRGAAIAGSRRARVFHCGARVLMSRPVFPMGSRVILCRPFLFPTRRGVSSRGGAVIFTRVPMIPGGAGCHDKFRVQ